ncbi:hypothetical protein HY374_02630 [Candidatus Berkelbacteria bacterium]|nr:hypothetical protein [Candidatus Berkelbacteria bacterium]
MMDRTQTASFLKFNYLLRPSKQVERKLLIEALHRLSVGGVRVSEYTYLGFGSIYYADFLLFHKYLYIDKMICVEAAPIPKRMRFNKPFDRIRLRMTRVSDVLPTLKRRVKYIVWLDYDYGINEEILQDTASCLYLLAPGSILIVTVEAEPRLPEDRDSEELTGEERTERLRSMLQEQVGMFVRGKITRRVLTRNSFPRFLSEVLRAQFSQEMARRGGVKFLQLFNFRYADGAQMLTLGGVIADDEVEKQVSDSGVLDLDFVEAGPEPRIISVPPLTLREKHWLDKRLGQIRKAGDVSFELEDELLQNFRRYYRHYPTYYETLI